MTHKEKTAIVSDKVRGFYSSKTPFRIYHGSTNSTRILSFEQDKMLDMSKFDEIISIDTKSKTVVVEPNVPMDKLIKETLRYNLVPPVIPEFPGITVGGAIQGGAGESSSFKWGFFSQTTNWVEYITGDSSIVRASKDEHQDLYYGAAGSCGTLGVITSTEIQLIAAKKYVALEYTHVSSPKEAVTALQSLSSLKNGPDFIDCIMFSQSSGVIIKGNMTNQKSGRIKRFSRACDNWFYLHIQDISASDSPAVDYVPLTDYLFRYNRGAFWVGKFAFELFDVPYNRLTRFVLNPILNTRKLYQALQVSGASQEYLVQDLTLSSDKSVDFLNFVDENIGIYPLWLCPILPEPQSQLSCNGLDTGLAINIGIWGPRITNYERFVATNRLLEKELAKSSGKKWMYAHAYYTEEEFWNIYDKPWYDNLRKAYHAEYMSSIYDKIVVKKRYEVNPKKGLWRTIFGLAKLRIEK